MSAGSKFHKKVYKKLEASPLPSSIPSFSHEAATKKIIPSIATTGMREEFTKTFLPIMIDVFEMRQMIDTYKTESNAPSIPLGKETKSPKEILKKLEERQADIEEARRWCDGVILQIAKGIEEAKEALAILEENTQAEKPSLLKGTVGKVHSHSVCAFFVKIKSFSNSLYLGICEFSKLPILLENCYKICKKRLSQQSLKRLLKLGKK